MRILLSLSIFTVLTCVQCKKDDRADAFTGMYNGSYSSSASGGSLTFDDIKADVTKRSDDEVKIEITPFPGLVLTVNATATSETRLVVESQQVFSSETQGEGELYDGGRRLKLTLNHADGSKTTYDGERQ